MTTEVLIALIATFVAILAGLSSIASGLSSRRKLMIEDGREVELQTSSTHIQWRYVGDSTWNDLVLLEDLKGDTGATGPSGTLNTNNTTTLTPSPSESLAGGVSLHKVSKTGDYNDLVNKPGITVNDDESDELSIVDSQGNIVAKITSEGIQAVNFLVGIDKEEVALANDINNTLSDILARLEALEAQ